METLGSSTPGDGSHPPKEANGDGSMKHPADLKFYHLPRQEQHRQQRWVNEASCGSEVLPAAREMFDDYLTHLAPRLRPISEDDNVKRFYDLCDAWLQYLSVRGLILQEIIVSLVCHNALRCTNAVFQ